MNEQPSTMNQPMMNPAPPPPTGMMSTMSIQPSPPQFINPQQSHPQVIANRNLLLPHRRGQRVSFRPSRMSYNSRMNAQKPFQSLSMTNGCSNLSQMLMNPPPQMMNRGYGMWGHPPPSQPMDLQMKYQNPNQKAQAPGGFGKLPSKYQLGPRNNWKGRKVNKVDKRKDLGRRMEIPMSIGGTGALGTAGNGGFNLPSMGMTGSGVGGGGAVGGFNPPSLKDLQYQNRVKTRRYFPKNYNNNNYNNKEDNMGKFAPRNTSSFIIRAKRSGGIADLVSPCPVTPSVLPTPVFSPSREFLVDMAKEWGVDGYGSMKGLIRLRSPGSDGHYDDDEEGGGSSGSDVEEHVEVERRLDHDLSRFEMIYPNYGTVGGMDYNNLLENRVDDQHSHIAQLEEENLILKERLFLMERELGDMQRRLQSLEGQSQDGDYGNAEVVDNLSENESDNRGSHSIEYNNEGLGEDNEDPNLEFQAKEDNSNQVAIKVEKYDAEYSSDHKVEQSSKQDATELVENNAEDSHNEGEQYEIKDSVLESNENNSEDGKKHGEVSVDIAVGEISEENKDENIQINKDGNDNAQCLGDNDVGGDICMHEVASNEN